ncbi:MAG: hypothetical protein IPK25_14490 [Saprospiraceae bacterium]|nr:hypothetical protein [Saprospiraceae bacterium]
MRICEQVSEPKYFDFTVNPLPRVVLGRDTIICDQDEGFEIKIDNFVDITWNDGSKANSIYFEESGIYEVMVKDENGCIGHVEIVIRDFCCKSTYYPEYYQAYQRNYINRQFQIKEVRGVLYHQNSGFTIAGAILCTNPMMVCCRRTVPSAVTLLNKAFIRYIQIQGIG